MYAIRSYYEFNRDVVIDLICYRKHGHNEADEPAATQPMMYKIIRGLDTTRQKYADDLVRRGIIEPDYPQMLVITSYSIHYTKLYEVLP